MKKLNIFKTFDTFFRILLEFLFAFVWCRYYISSLLSSILASIFVTVIFEVLYIVILNKKTKNKSIKQQELNDIQAYTNTFVYGEQTNTANFFLELAKTKHTATKKSNFIIIDHTTSKVILYPYFMYKDFTADDLIYVYNKTKSINASKIIICTNTIESSTNKIIDKLPTKIFVLDHQQTYIQLLKEYNFYPQKTHLNSTTKQSFKQLVSYALNKKRTKGYFFTSVLLLFYSFFVPYKLYYVIMSSILLLLSYFSFSNTKFNNNLPHNVLEIS